jgi:pimeloyl-ACP methyl ester carboxylesterase
LHRKFYDISLDRGNAHVAADVRDGGGDMLLLIHGLGCSGESYRQVWEYPSFRQCIVVVPDLPGFGQSGFSDGFSCSLEDYAAVCRGLIDLFDYRRLHIVGHSMGGAVGVLLCTLMGEGVSSFINVEGNLVAADCGVSRKIMSMPYEEFLGTGCFELHLMADSSGEKGVRMWASMAEQASPEAVYRSASSLVKWSDSGALLAEFLSLRCRKVYIYGEKNRELKSLADIGSIQTREILRCGHFPMNDNPDEFYGFLAEWLAIHGAQLSSPQ